MLEISGNWWYYDEETKKIWAAHTSSSIGDTDIATLHDLESFNDNNGRLIAEAPVMYDLLNKAFHMLGKNAANDTICREIDECLSRVDGVPVQTEEGE